MLGYEEACLADNKVAAAFGCGGFVDESIDAFFNPKTVAVVGATEKPGIGRVTISNLMSESQFAGAIWGINPGRTTVLGLPCFPSLDKCPSVPDLVVIVTPAVTVPPIIKQCVALRVKAVIVISAGFKEIGPKGKALEDEIEALLKSPGSITRVVGPNCFGILCGKSHLNATFGTNMVLPGSCALVTQSGAMLVTLLDWAIQNNIGFSSMVSVGSMLDLTWAEVLLYLGNDPATKFITLYMESIGDARTFLAAAREVCLRKPIVVLKPGRTSAAAKAALSHTGSLAGSDNVLDAAFKRAGIIRVDTMRELSDTIMMLSFAPIPKGPNTAIITHAGGPGVLCADALAQAGGELAAIPPEVIKVLDETMPRHWSLSNPIDITGGATPEHYQRCLDVISTCPAVDSVIVVVGPLSGICPGSSVAQYVKNFTKSCGGKPAVSVMLGGDELLAARKLLLRAGLPVFDTSDGAAAALTRLWNYRKWLNELYEPAKELPATYDYKTIPVVDAILENVQKQGRTILTEAESKKVLSAYGIPISETVTAKTADEAAAAATKMGFPVVAKLLSETITHKSDVGGVILSLNSEQQVREAFETIKTNLATHYPTAWEKHFLGITVQPMFNLADGQEILLGGNTDAQLGPVVVFGSGGKMVEIYKDSSLGLPPLTSTNVKLMMKQTKVFKALLGVRGSKSVDIDKLTSIIMAFGDMLVNHPLIKECDINPIFASSQRIIAVDARVVIWDQSQNMASIPKAAVASYPRHLVKEVDVNGKHIVVRPLMPTDAVAWMKWRGLDETAVAQATHAILLTSSAFTLCAFENGVIISEARIVKGTRDTAVCALVKPAPQEIAEQLYSQAKLAAASLIGVSNVERMQSP